MSAAATAYVIRCSPYEGVGLLLHLMVADVVNDANDNRFWMSPTELARKARTTRVSASNWLWQRAVKDGMLEVVVDNRSVRSPKTGYAPPSEFRFLEPDVTAAYEPLWKTKQGPPPASQPSHADADDRVKPNDAVVEPRQDSVRGPVKPDDAAIREPAGQAVEPRKASLRVTQELTKTPELKENADAEIGAALVEDESSSSVADPVLAEDDDRGADASPRLFAVPAAETTATAIAAAAIHRAGSIQWPPPKWRNGDDEDQSAAHNRQVHQVRQALRGWALGRLLADDPPEQVTEWAIELCRVTPAVRWSSTGVQTEWERMTGRASTVGGRQRITPAVAQGFNVRQIVGHLLKKPTDFSMDANEREVLHDELRRRFDITFEQGISAPGALTGDDARVLGRTSFTGVSADFVSDLCAEIRERTGANSRTPEAEASEAALRSIVAAQQHHPSTTRALNEGSTW